MKETRISAVQTHLILAARELAAQVDLLKFKPPVTHVYNPLDYAWSAHERYLRQYGGGKKRIVFLGMNPGPFGMTQTGIPFGEIAAVRDWLGISAAIRKPELCHPKRPVTGFDCLHSEVSGRRLWGLFRERFGTPENFFADHFVANYCPLAFMGKSGSNLTPDKLRKAECKKLFQICDAHLRRVLEILDPEWLIGIGGFAARQGTMVVEDLKNEDGGGRMEKTQKKHSTRLRHATHLRQATAQQAVRQVFNIQRPMVPAKIQVGQILHPSPASPAANRGWAEAAMKQLVSLGIWKEGVDRPSLSEKQKRNIQPPTQNLQPPMAARPLFKWDQGTN